MRRESRAEDSRGPQLPDGGEPGTGPEPGKVPDAILQRAIPALLVCERCHQVITSEDRRIEVEGAHVHRRTNPMGWRFEIGCFSVAPGVEVATASSTEYSWFVGRAWRVGRCGGCGIQLGWYFEGREPDFHGLILDRLAEA